MRRLVVLGVLLSFFTIGASSAMAETGKKALVLGSTVSGGPASHEATRAADDGFTVTVVDDATWDAMTAAQFADYQLVIIGDPDCSTMSPAVSQNTTALADAVMGRAGGNTKAGNRILIGTDPAFHYDVGTPGALKLIQSGIDFAGVQEGATGLYLDFSCQDTDYDGNGVPDAQDKLLPKLSIDPTPGWTQNTSPPCGGDVSLISNAAQFSTLHSSDLRGWGCSVHESFPQFPSDWNPLAIATDTPTHPTCGSDVDTGQARCGEAYLLIAGSGIVSAAPNLSLTPLTATNPVGTQHTVTATVTNTDDTPRSGVTVSFVVTGANAGASGTCNPAGCVTGSDGKVSFTYTGANEGDDTINASMTVGGSTQTATASKTWVAAGGGGPQGEMVGEGRLTQSSSKRLDYAYILDCEKANNVPPKFAGALNSQKFTLTSVTSVTCTDDPSVTPAKPDAQFDTMDGEGTGKVGSTPVTVDWEFVDGGVDGTDDSATIVITRTSDGTVLFSKSESPIGAFGGGTRPGRNTATSPSGGAT